MTFVFRFSSFVVVFVLATKVTLVLADNPGYLVDDTVIKAANRCLDESTRRRKEADEAREDRTLVRDALRRAARIFFATRELGALVGDRVSHVMGRGLATITQVLGFVKGSLPGIPQQGFGQQEPRCPAMG